MEYVMGIDLGTSSVKAVLMNREGKTTVAAGREYEIIFIKLAHGHFLADGVYPVVKVFLYLLDLLAQGKTGPLPGRYFVGGY